MLIDLSVLQLNSVDFLNCHCFFHVSTAAIGLLYPCMDRHLGEPHKFKREWSSVMRCVAVFVGINHASAVSYTAVMLPITYRFLVNQRLNSASQCNCFKYNVQF